MIRAEGPAHIDERNDGIFLEAGFTGTVSSTESTDQTNKPVDYTRHEALLPEGAKAFIKIEAAAQ